MVGDHDPEPELKPSNAKTGHTSDQAGRGPVSLSSATSRQVVVDNARSVVVVVLVSRQTSCWGRPCWVNDSDGWPAALLVSHEDVLDLSLLQYHRKLVVVQKVDHRMLKGEGKT